MEIEGNELNNMFRRLVQCSRDVYNGRVKNVLVGKKGRKLNFFRVSEPLSTYSTSEMPI